MRARDVIPLYSNEYHQQRRLTNRGGRHTRRSVLELFNAAQSSGLCPGARTTFSLFLDFDNWVGGFVVVGGGIKEDAVDGTGTPGIRGVGIDVGGGIRVDREVSWDEGAEGAEEIR